MGEVSKYEGKEKKYYVSKRKKINMKSFISLLVIPAILIMILSFLCLGQSISFNSKKDQISYNEIGSVDYKVYLKNNNYYDQKFLPKGMKYIASLINTVNVDFNYEMHSTEKLDYSYRYKINAKLVITDKSDKSKILYEKPFELLKEKNKGAQDNNFTLHQDIDIDYDEYNNYVNAFKKDYALTVDSNLIVTMDIVTEGITDKLADKINTSNKLEISIPLSEQTLDISITSKDLNKEGSIYKSDDIVINNYVLLIIGIILASLAIIFIIFALYIYLSSKKNKDIYTSTIDKYLREYDRMIITSKRPNIDETNFKEIIRVMSIEELIDTHDMTKQPIVYYEVIPGEKSYFVIMNGDLLYKLTISKAWLLKNK